MNSNMNPFQMIQMLRSAKDPQSFVCNMVESQMGNNPIFSNILSLAKCGRGNEIEVIARNMMKEKGLDFDKEFATFRKNLGL